MLKAWIWDYDTLFMDPSQQVVMRKPKGDPYAPHAACSEGFNAYRDSLCVFYIPPSGRGTTISPCGFIPLVSPGLHNPVKRNDQHVFTCGLKRGGKGEQRVKDARKFTKKQLELFNES